MLSCGFSASLQPPGANSRTLRAWLWTWPLGCAPCRFSSGKGSAQACPESTPFSLVALKGAREGDPAVVPMLGGQRCQIWGAEFPQGTAGWELLAVEPFGAWGSPRAFVWTTNFKTNELQSYWCFLFITARHARCPRVWIRPRNRSQWK